MLSSQTKDAVVADAIRRMQQDQVCSVTALADMTANDLNEKYIAKVGFHNLKTRYIQETVQILIEQYDGDIPPTAKHMMELPGVGPKMAFICENAAWNKTSGIGVDTHMHRLFNQLGWVQSKTPEQTRVQLETWLPQEKWKDVNLLWVGE
jgi:endonuclease-3